MTAKCGLCKKDTINNKSSFILELKNSNDKSIVKIDIKTLICNDCIERYNDLISMMPYLFYKMTYIDQDKLRKFINNEFETEWARTGSPH